MTCIAGIVKDGVVYMGGDSCGSCGTWQHVPDGKVFKVGDFLFGVCGSFRLIDLLKYSWPGIAPADQPVDRFLRTTFTSTVYDTMEKYKLNDRKGELDGMFLIGYAGQLYEFLPDYSILTAPDWGLAIGSGGEAARGSLFTTRRLKMDPLSRIMASLEAAEAVDTGVRAPFTIMTLGEKTRNTSSKKQTRSCQI